MRLIDADALIEQMEADMEQMEEPLAKMFTGAAISDVRHAPTVQPEQQWIPVTQESVIQAGYEGREVRFRIRGRLFAIRELAQ